MLRRLLSGPRLKRYRRWREVVLECLGLDIGQVYGGIEHVLRNQDASQMMRLRKSVTYSVQARGKYRDHSLSFHRSPSCAEPTKLLDVPAYWSSK